MKAEEKRLALIAAAEAAVAQYPQYAGKFKTLSIARGKQTVRTKMGVALKKGELVLFDPATYTHFGSRMFVTIWSNSNQVHTSVPCGAVEHVHSSENV